MEKSIKNKILKDYNKSSKSTQKITNNSIGFSQKSTMNPNINNSSFINNVLEVLRLRLKLEQIEIDEEILNELIANKLKTVNTRVLDMKAVNSIVEILLKLIKQASSEKVNPINNFDSINEVDINIDRTEAISADISSRKWLDTCIFIMI